MVSVATKRVAPSRRVRLVSFALLCGVAVSPYLLLDLARIERLRAYAERGEVHLRALESATADWRAAGTACSEATLAELRRTPGFAHSPWGTVASISCLEGRFVASFSVYEPICSLLVGVLISSGRAVLIDGSPPTAPSQQCARAGAVAAIL